MASDRPEIVVLAPPCCYASALASVVFAAPVGDDYLSKQIWPFDTAYRTPLLRCRFVLQVTVEQDTPQRSRWRLDAFWRLYDKLGGRHPRAEGLRWLQIGVGRNASEIPAELREIIRSVPAEIGLANVLRTLHECPALHAKDWLHLRRANREELLRQELFQLVSSVDAGEDTVCRCKELHAQISQFEWERFCPPPQDHALANQIRRWLDSPVTNPVTLWLSEGAGLLRKTTLEL